MQICINVSPFYTVYVYSHALNNSATEIGTLQNSQINAITADALVSCLADTLVSCLTIRRHVICHP